MPRLLYKFSALPVKIPAGLFSGINKLMINFMQKCKGPVVKTVLKKNKGERRLANFKTYNKATVIRTVALPQRCVDQGDVKCNLRV